MTAPIRMLAATGRGAFQFLAAIGRLGEFSGNLFRWLLIRQPFWAEVLNQCVRIGVNSVLIISLINFFVGANVALVGDAIFRQFGGQNLLGIYVGLSCIVGMSPIIVGAMLCAKPGTEITAMIASMRVKEQIDALEVMAVNPFWYLIVPRFIAFMLVTPALVTSAYFASVLGGYVCAVFQIGNNPGTFLADIVRFLTVQDLANGIIRGQLFAVVTCIVACFYGYTSAPGPAGVSRAINLAVVFGSVTIIILNYFLTEFLY